MLTVLARGRWVDSSQRKAMPFWHAILSRVAKGSSWKGMGGKWEGIEGKYEQCTRYLYENAGAMWVPPPWVDSVTPSSHRFLNSNSHVSCGIPPCELLARRFKSF